jgi:hypothetical protein
MKPVLKSNTLYLGVVHKKNEEPTTALTVAYNKAFREIISIQ